MTNKRLIGLATAAYGLLCGLTGVFYLHFKFWKPDYTQLAGWASRRSSCPAFQAAASAADRSSANLRPLWRVFSLAVICSASKRKP